MLEHVLGPKKNHPTPQGSMSWTPDDQFSLTWSPSFTRSFCAINNLVRQRLGMETRGTVSSADAGAGILKVVHPICSLDSQYTFKIDKSCAMPAWVYTRNSEVTSSQRSQLARNKNIYNYASRTCAESRKT